MKQELQSAHIYSESMVLIKGEEKMAQVRDYNKLAHDIIREVGVQKTSSMQQDVQPDFVWY